MQVILLKSVRKVGTAGEVVKVKDGFGRNYLIPQSLAKRATKENLKEIEQNKKDLEALNTAHKKEAEEVAKLIEGRKLLFALQSATDGRLFGSVSQKFLATEITKITGNFKLNYSNIIIESPIKYNGVYNVKVLLHPEVIANVIVAVAKSESEAQDALRAFQNNDELKVESDSVN